MNSSKTNIAMICKLMPFYRLGVFQKLSAFDGPYRFSFFGDAKEEGGIKQIPYSYSQAKRGKKIRWINTKNFFYKPERILWQTGIIKEIFKSHYKVFVFEGAIAHFPYWIFASLCKLRGKKVLFWTHGNRGLDKGIKKMLRVVLFKWIGDGLLLYGNTQKDIMIADGYDPNRLFVIYNSLQPEKQLKVHVTLERDHVEHLKGKIFKNPKFPTLIFIGRLVTKKGIIEILKTLNILKQQDVSVNCIIIGEGKQKPILENYIEEHQLMSQIHFAGELYEEKDLAPLFMMSDLLISPGGVGLNCVHSLGYGVPVITHNDPRYHGPEVEAIIEGKTGTFFKHNDLNDLVLKVKNWINNRPDDDLIYTICKEVITTTYNPEHQSQCIIAAIDKTLKSNE